MAGQLKRFDHKDWSLLIGLASEGEVRFDTYAAKYPGGTERNANIINLPAETAHALADWIIAKVPKPEPTPLPTKFAAVVNSDGRRFVRTDHTMYPWTDAAGTYSDQEINNMGFEVIYEGVDD